QLTLAQEQARHLRTPFIMPILQAFEPGGSGFVQAPIKAVSSSLSIKFRNASGHPAVYTHFILKQGDAYFITQQPIEIIEPGSEAQQTLHLQGPLNPTQVRSVLTREYRQ